MKVAGIVAEYNPFHNGHAYQIEKTKDPYGDCRATHVVAVMGGNFMQRGGPAIMPKPYRVESALNCGVDLVLELPLPWSMATAEKFSYGAVSMFDMLGCVDVLSFGSESGDINDLNKINDILISSRFSDLLKYHLDGGNVFPAAREKAVAEIAGQNLARILSKPNNILAIEYIKALNNLNSHITPFTIKRFAVSHDDMLPVGEFASASYLRQLMRAGRINNILGYIPNNTASIVNKCLKLGYAPSDENLIQRAVIAKLRTLSVYDIALLPGISEGLENRVYQAVQKSSSLEELYENLKTRRYTFTRFKRIVWSAFLGLESGWENRKPPYIRVLGMNNKGAEIISKVKKDNEDLIILTRSSKIPTLTKDLQSLFELESQATDLFALTLPKPFECGTEYTNGIIRLYD